MSVHRRPQISRQLLEGAIDAVEVGEGEAIRHAVVFSGMSVRGVGFIAMSRRSHSVSPVSRKEPCRINRSMSASGTFRPSHSEPWRRSRRSALGLDSGRWKPRVPWAGSHPTSPLLPSRCQGRLWRHGDPLRGRRLRVSCGIVSRSSNMRVDGGAPITETARNRSLWAIAVKDPEKPHFSSASSSESAKCIA